MPLHDAIRRFLEYCEVERGRSPATIRMYGFVLERFMVFAEQHRVKSAEGITLELVRQFRLWLHRRPGRNGETVARSTENLHLVVLRALLKYLAKYDIPSLAADKIELAKQPDREVEFLEPEEVERLLAAPFDVAGKLSSSQALKHRAGELVRLRDKAILEVLFSTGMRVGELVSLTRDGVNLDRDEFAVRGKGSKVRVVFLSPEAKQWLKKYLEVRRDLSPYLFVRHDRASSPASSRAKRPIGAKSRDLDRDFSAPLRSGRNDAGEDHHPLTSRSVERLVARYARAAGIVKPVHPHTLRHSFATDLLRNGAQIREVQAMLGHSSLTTTQVYTHVTEGHLRATHQKYHHKK